MEQSHERAAQRTRQPFPASDHAHGPERRVQIGRDGRPRPPSDRRLAHERLVNFEWELRVESLRLRVIEAQIALEAKLAEVRELQAEVYRAHVQIAAKTLEPMQARYRRRRRGSGT